MLLSFGQHDEAEQIFERLLADEPDPAIRDRTWFWLGKAKYQRGYLKEAESALGKVAGALPAELEAERVNLSARIYIDQQRFGEAIDLLQDWQGPERWAAYARYNLGVALVRRGDIETGAEVLARVGELRTTDAELVSLRDRANVALGFAYLQSDAGAEAKAHLQRVRLNGPFSSKALLGAGWADSAQQSWRSALVPWSELSRRDLLDSAVQESLLAVPYAYAQLRADSQAAEHYGRALDTFDAEIVRIDAAIAGAATGELIELLLISDEAAASSWYWQLNTLPDDDRSRYLYHIIANHAFNEGLKDYRDLAALARHLTEWQSRLEAYRHMVETRRVAFEQRMPQLQERWERLDVDAMQRKREELEQQVARAIEQRDPVALATVEEQDMWRRLEGLRRNPAFESAAASAQRDKHRLLTGVLQWRLEKEFAYRAWSQQRNIEELGEQVAEARRRDSEFDSASRALPAELDRYAARIAALEPRIERMLGQVEVAMGAYGNHLNQLAVEEMKRQRKRLATYRAQARFSLASIHDRMAARAD